MSRYIAKMNSYVHNHNYPVNKHFNKKSTAVEYIKRGGLSPRDVR
jgi:hypothetical protein